MVGRRKLRIVYLVSVVAFFLMSAGWAVGLPVNGTYDEDQHIIRAYAVASGQFYAPPTHSVWNGGARFQVPRSLLPPDPNCTWRKHAPASCQGHNSHDTRPASTGSSAGRYNPVYYLPVGLPMVASPNTAGITLGRLVSGLLSALLLGSAVVIAVRWGSRLMLAAVLLAATPMAVNLAGSINPNGAEICAGVLVWAGLLALVRSRDGQFEPAVTRRLLILTAVGSGVLLTVRGLGPLWLGLIAVTCLLVARRGRVRALLGRVDTRWLIGGLAALAVYAVGWTVLAGGTDYARIPGHYLNLGLGSAAKQIITTRMGFWISQLVGQFSYGETTLPNWFLIVWYALVGAIVVPTIAVVRRRFALVLVGIVVGSFLVLAGFELAYLHTIGWSQHGRYVMPFAVGLVLAAAIRRRYEGALGARGSARLARGVAICVALLQPYALAVVISRFKTGTAPGGSAFAGSWHPQLGTVVPVLVAMLGVVLLGALVWRLTATAGTARSGW